jgi:hypothetical protein
VQFTEPSQVRSPSRAHAGLSVVEVAVMGVTVPIDVSPQVEVALRNTS